MKPFRLSAALLGLLLFAPLPATAQQPTHRLSIGIGVLTAPDWLDITSDVLRTAVTLGSYKTEARSGTGAISAQYERFLNSRLSLLGAAGFQRMSRDVIIDDTPSGTLSSSYAHAMAGAALHYRRGGGLGLYSNASVGFALNHDSADITGSPSTSESEFQPAFQVTALGLRVGQSYGAFLELGAGYRGTIVLGAAFEF